MLMALASVFAMVDENANPIPYMERSKGRKL
jgi:hypothetical protein